MAESTRPLTPPPPSKLGTKDYWADIYAKDTELFSARPDSPTSQGICWFSESGAEEKVIGFLQDDVCVDGPATTFLDLGTGNGHLLFALREEGFEGRMLGVDYVESAVELAKRIDEREGRGVGFKVWDCVAGDVAEVLDEGGEKWDVVLDKGTFDAIGLAEDGRRAEDGYLERAKKLVKMGGLLVITSCNWTEEELTARFLGAGGLKVEGKVHYPSFTFGGKKGQTICTVAFRRIEE